MDVWTRDSSDQVVEHQEGVGFVELSNTAKEVELLQKRDVEVDLEGVNESSYQRFYVESTG